MAMRLKFKLFGSICSIPLALILFQNTTKTAERYCLQRDEVLQFCGTPHTIVTLMNLALIVLGVILPGIYLIKRSIDFNKILGIGMILLTAAVLVTYILFALANPLHGWHF